MTRRPRSIIQRTIGSPIPQPMSSIRPPSGRRADEAFEPGPLVKVAAAQAVPGGRILLVEADDPFVHRHLPERRSEIAVLGSRREDGRLRRRARADGRAADRRPRDRRAAVLDAFREVPREAFVPEAMREFAYEDGPLPIEAGQTISQPYIVALMIEAAEVGAGRPGARDRRRLGLCRGGDGPDRRAR